ncbi:MAG TPA: diacylglycerol kinase family protein [bacterium]|nr:diacylglycerol kinase family protein [bacterium]
MTRWALICNPTAGGYRPDVPERVQSALAGQGVEVHVQRTQGAGHAVELAQALNGVACVAAYGGDGTVREVAKGLLGRDLPLAFLPGGSGNSTAKELGLPLEPVAAALASLQGRVLPIRLGHINGEPFVNMAGIGFDALAVHLITPQLKARLGPLAYIAAGFRCLVHRHPALRLHTPAGERRARWVVGARASRYAGLLRIHPTAHMTRPVLGLAAVNGWMLLPFGIGRLLLHLPVRGPGLTLEEHAGFRVTSSEPVHAHVDGDYLGQGTSFELGLLEQPVSFCLPGGKVQS